MMNNLKDYNDKLEAILYFPAKPIQIALNLNPNLDFKHVTYEFLSGKRRVLPTLNEVIESDYFESNKLALFSANQYQNDSKMVVNVHPSDSLISIERRKS